MQASAENYNSQGISTSLAFQFCKSGNGLTFETTKKIAQLARVRRCIEKAGSDE
jgi:hypothetical protein